MKRSRLSEEQIIAILKEQENGMAMADVCRRHADQFGNFLSVEIEGWRAGGVRCPAAANTGAREREVDPKGRVAKAAHKPDA